MLEVYVGRNEQMERETGFEPATFSLARRRSSQLSYSRFQLLKIASTPDVVKPPELYDGYFLV
jgi:hypothetical protein